MESYIGQIILFAGNFAIRNYAQCDGALLPISQNTALFSILGTTYGGDGRTTFQLPDLRGRVVVHRGSGPGLTPRNLGQVGGSETVTLTELQIPSHTHTATSAVAVSNAAGEEATAQGNVLANLAGAYAEDPSAGATLGGVSTTLANTGGSQAHNNIQPFQTLNYQICLVGLFPSRN